MDGYVLSAFDNLEEAKIFAEFLDQGKNVNDELSVIHGLFVFSKADHLMRRK